MRITTLTRKVDDLTRENTELKRKLQRLREAAAKPSGRVE
jgi:hypothetical protein